MSGRLYNAYPSDSESDTDTGSTATDLTQSSDVTEEYLINVPGTKAPVASGGYGMPGKGETAPTNSGTELKFTPIENTSLFMLNSRDRDTKVYPLPTFFTLRLPRVYKNVKMITLSQINLLNSFFNFTAAQKNTSMYVYEEGRVLADGSSNVVKVQIRDGTYNTTDLVTELTNAMNATPIFANIGFTAFLSQFQLNGNFSILFNTPGPVVYNSLTNTYEYNLSISDIVARYFQTSQTSGIKNFTYNEAIVAYYYPIIKEMIIAANVSVPFSTTGLEVPIGFTSWYDYIVYGFQGVNDPNILAIATIPANEELFANYHYQNTFNTSLVNQYSCTYNSQQGRLVISAPSLNQSIAADLNTEYSNILNSLILANTTYTSIDQFNSVYASLQYSNSVLIAFYNWFQGQFTSNFGIDFGTYSLGFYGNSNNNIALYNTLNQFGWNLTLTPTVSVNQINSNAPAEQSSNYWPNISFPKTARTPAVSTFVSTINLGQLKFPNDAGESQYGYVDISFSILPTSYIRAIFQTPCRQNLNFLTIPRYINERSPGTDEVYNFNINTSTPSLLFDVRTSPNLYILTDVSGNTLFNMYTIFQNMFNTADYMRSLDQWVNYMYTQILSGTRLQTTSPNYNKNPVIGDIGLTSFRPFIFFQVNADQYPLSPDAYFNITFYVESMNNVPFPAELTITWYKDRAGFMADVLQALPSVNPSVENPRHYFQTQTYGAGSSSAQMTVPVTNLQQTYFYVHYTNSTNQPAINLRVFCILSDVYGTYTQATQNDLLDMPFANLPPLADQYTPASAVYNNDLISIYSTSVTTLGYDISGVSNNLTDYIIVAPNNNYYDPDNIGDYLDGFNSGLRYQFNLSNAGAPQPLPSLVPPWSLYFGSNSANTILDLYNPENLIYFKSSQTQVVGPDFHNDSILATVLDYTQTVSKEIYLNPAQDPYMPITSTTIFQPCINYGTTLISDSSTSTAFADTTGISGVSFFIPPDDVFKMNEVVLKFAYTAPTQTNFSENITRVSSPYFYYGYNNVNQGVLNGYLYNNRGSSTNALGNVFLDIPNGYIQEYTNAAYALFNAYLTLQDYTSLQTLFNATQTGVNYTYPGGVLFVYINNYGTGTQYSFPLGVIAFYGYNNTFQGYEVQFFNLSYIKLPNPVFSNDEYPAKAEANIKFFSPEVWDDWYLWNRINTKIGIFPTSQIQGVSTATLSLSSALFTLSLNKVTQVCQSANLNGTLRARDPDWGTFYQYTVNASSTQIWAPLTTNISTQFNLITLPADIQPTYTAGENSYPGYTLSQSQIFNYTYLPRTYGIAPSVGNAVNYPYPGVSSYTADIANSYTAVPFSYNVSTSTWNVGSFYALSFTRIPALPSTGLIGAAPYYGPPGIFAWRNNSSNVFSLYNGEQPTFQPYYWMGKVSFDILENIDYNPATDLSMFGGFSGISNEYQDTMMFFYENSTIGQDYKDISTNNAHWCWGNEKNSNYIAYDDQSGYNYLSYIYQQFVTPDVPEYAIHVRAYDPIPKFNTGLRIIGKNYTDFGTPTLGDIAIEISSLQGYTPITDAMGSAFLTSTVAYNTLISTNDGIRLGNGNKFSHYYANSLINFNNQIITSSITFGATSGFNGRVFSFAGYGDALSQYTSYYSTVQTEYVIFTQILSTATGLLNEYIVLRYGNVLPTSVLQRTQYTAPIPFQLLFNYNLVEPYASQFDQWGLGWYLGFAKQPAPVYGPRTRVTSDTFIRIVQDYVYLRLNPAYNANTLAVSAKEDLSQTRESQGMDTQYFTKIILNDFAGFSRAGVQLDKIFSPVLGKYEVIECQLTDKNGNTLSNADCDYDMVIQITEVTNVPTTDSSLLGPKSNLLVYENK